MGSPEEKGWVWSGSDPLTRMTEELHVMSDGNEFGENGETGVPGPMTTQPYYRVHNQLYKNIIIIKDERMR